MPQVTIHGIPINYRITGHGQPLVMISGLGSDHMVWGLQAGAFRSHYRCLTFDNRGSGGSGSGDVEFSIPLLAGDTAALMDALGIEQAHILGTSMGGAIAMELALLYPYKVSSLSLNATWPKTDRYLEEVLDVLIATAGGAAPDLSTLRRLIYLYNFTPAYFDERTGGYEKMFGVALAQHFDAQAFVKQAQACLNHDVSDKLHRINVPTLITAGDRDILTPPYFAEAIRSAIPGSRLEILPGAGHGALLERPALFNEVHLCFWAGRQ